LENAHVPILKRASIGLCKLTTNDEDWIIRLIVRRCSLNLIEIHPEHVVVHHWGSHLADLKPFFKSNGFARPEVSVLLKDRKREAVVEQPGGDFLYGNSIATDFDLELFQSKWARRFVQEADDWQAVPASSSGFAWDGLPDGSIPWAAMRSAWRRSAPGVCLNCSGETFWMIFGLRPVGQFNRSPNFVSVCRACLRSYRNESVKDVRAWIVDNLDAEVRPDAEMVWRKRLKLESRS